MGVNVYSLSFLLGMVDEHFIPRRANFQKEMLVLGRVAKLNGTVVRAEDFLPD